MDGQSWWVMVVAAVVGGIGGQLVTWAREIAKSWKLSQDEKDARDREQALFAWRLARKAVSALSGVRWWEGRTRPQQKKAAAAMELAERTAYEMREHEVRLHNELARKHLGRLLDVLGDVAALDRHEFPHRIAIGLGSGFDAVFGPLIRGEEVPKELPEKAAQLLGLYAEVLEENRAWLEERAAEDRGDTAALAAIMKARVPETPGEGPAAVEEESAELQKTAEATSD